ncbi:MAG: DUF5658 family protein [Novipirellula sp. JB048]
MTGIAYRNRLRLTPSLIAFLLVAIIWGSCCSDSSPAQSSPFWDGADGWQQPIVSDQMYVFIDGVYLAPPYKIQFSENELLIGDRTYSTDVFDFSGYMNQRSDPFRGIHLRVREVQFGGVGDDAFLPEIKPDTGISEFAALLHSRASSGVLVLFSGEAPMLLDFLQEGRDLLSALLKKGDGLEPPHHQLDYSYENLDPELCERLLAEFEPTPEFTKRAKLLIDEQDRVIATNERKAIALIWAQKISYPLSLFAMILVVFAFGHLISNPQQLVGDIDDPQVINRAKHATVNSLAILGLLSSIDLVWTLIAHESGTMRELNPLGNGLIDQPTHLVLFKLTLTGLSIGLLYRLQHLPLARRATWWCCLVLTLLTARWLTFNSMFL